MNFDGKIVKLDSLELLNSIQEGYFICDKCGSIMNLNDNDQLYCSCGYTVSRDDYDEYYDDEDDDEPPFGCRACGGPYPQCKTSCKMFDE